MNFYIRVLWRPIEYAWLGKAGTTVEQILT